MDVVEDEEDPRDETTSEIPARARTPPTISKIRKTLTKAIIALDQAPPASVCRPSARGLPHGRTPRAGKWSEKPYRVAPVRTLRTRPRLLGRSSERQLFR